MQRLVLTASTTLAIAGTCIADTFDFPSADSTVVASVGFRDGENIGAFWSQVRGDRVTEFFADPASEVTGVRWELDITRQGLREPLEWALLINGVEVASVSYFTESGPQVIEATFPAIASSGGGYEVSFECRSTVAPGLGSMDLRYAGAGPFQIELIGESCRVDLDGDGSLTIFDFLEFQNLFDAGDPLADFDGDGSLTIFDFLAFQNEFDAGCE